MENKNEFEQAPTGGSLAYGIGFWIFYVIVVFAVLGLFFKIPF